MSRRFTRRDFERENDSLQNEKRDIIREEEEFNSKISDNADKLSGFEERQIKSPQKRNVADKQEGKRKAIENDKPKEQEILENEEKHPDEYLQNNEKETQTIENEEKDEKGDEKESSVDNNSEEENKEDKGEEDKKEKDEYKESEDAEKDSDDNDKKSEKDNKEKDNKDSSELENRKNLGPNRGQKSEDKPGGTKNLKDSIKNKALEKVGEQIGDKDGKIAKAQELATKVSAAIKTLSTSAGFLGKMLVNPVFWIAVALLIVVGAISSSVAVIGGNDYNKACDANGVGEVNVADDADDFTRQSAIASWLMSTPFEVNGGKPFTKEQASGILGNFIEESYGANPKTIQGDATMKRWESCDNNCVAAFQGGGQAVGILQWDGAAGDPRRATLVELAKSEGKQWYDLDVQLKHIKNELDALGPYTYENTQIKRSGFLDAGKTVEEYATLWAKFIERCGKCRMEDRTASAKEFYGKYQGGGGSIGGGITTQCVGETGGAIDASNLAQLAIQISYSREEKAAGKGFGVCPTLPHCGDSFSKPEFIQAKKLAEETTGVDGGAEGLTASCDRLAATLFRLTGIDDKFPWGGSAAQIAYMDSSPKWKRVSCQERQPGDAIARPGHIMVYIGNIDGRETISSASIALASRVGSGQGRAAHLSDLSCKGDSWYADGANSLGWRRVN